MSKLISALTRVKEDYASEKEGGSNLTKPPMSFIKLTLYGIGGVVGAGVFTSPGSILNSTDCGSGIILSFLVAGLVCAITGICYADYAARMPSAGGSYSYVYSTLGEFCAWLAAIGNTFEYAFAAAAVARSFSRYAISFWQILAGSKDILPKDVADNSKPKWFEIDYIAPVLTIATTLLCLLGLRNSSRIAAVLTVANVGSILLIIFFGLFTGFKGSNFTNGFKQTGFSKIMNGASLATFCFIAWDSACVFSEDVRNPKKVIPRAIFTTVGVVGSLFMLMIAVLCGMLDVTNVSNKTALKESPFLLAFAEYKAVQYCILVVILLCSINVVFACTQGQPKIWLGIARDGLLPKRFAFVDEESTPKFSIIITGILTTITCAFINFDVIADATAIAVLLVQGLVSTGCFIERNKRVNGKTESVTKAMVCICIVTSTLAAAFLQLADKSADHEVSYKIAAYSFLGISGLAGIGAVATTTPQGIMPALAMFLNFFLVGYTGFVVMGQLAAIIAVFSALYFGYGMQNSVLAKNAH
jgi:basic amino acid/polyamine antiporter, APA family